MTRVAALPSALLISLFCTALALAQEVAPSSLHDDAGAAQTADVLGDAGAAVATDPLSAQLAAMEQRLAAQEQQIRTLTERAQEAEIAALAEPAAPPDLSPSQLKLYGFMDMGYDKFFLNYDNKGDILLTLRNTSAGSFVFGNLNLYIDASPVERWRTLMELRFTLAPNGQESGLGPSYERVNTTAFDYSSPSFQAQFRWGGVFIERAYTEWTFTDWLQVRAGIFLNPFGIWNVDHGSPTLIALMLPTFVAGQMMPSRLLGVQTLGSWQQGNYSLGYSLHVSNGRAQADFDLTDDKAVGARTYLAHYGSRAEVVLGASGYWGTYADRRKVSTYGSGEGNYLKWETAVAYTEYVGGLDLSVEAKHVRLKAEAVVRRVNYERGKREQVFAFGDEAYAPDRLEQNLYLLLAWRSGWGLEPYATFEYVQRAFVLPTILPGQNIAPDRLAMIGPSVGVNYSITANTMLKLQMPWGFLFRTEPKFEHLTTVPILLTRIVSSF